MLQGVLVRLCIEAGDAVDFAEADVAIDFSLGESVFENAKAIIITILFILPVLFVRKCCRSHKKYKHPQPLLCSQLQ